MSQLQVHNASLDCAESRTVRSIQTLRRYNNSRQQQQQQQQKYNAGTNNRRNNAVITHSVDTCHQTLIECNKARQQQQSARQHTSCKTKSYVLLPIVFFAILVQSSYATPVTLSGKRLILHTSEYRERQHQELLERERAAAYAQPTPPHHRHHLHLRSLRGMSMNGAANGGGDSEYCQQVVEALQYTLNQANVTYKTLRGCLNTYVESQYSSEASEVQKLYRLHKLNLQHPYRNVLEIDFDQLPAADAQHFGSIVDQPISEAMISAELVKVYTTLTILDKVFAQLNEARKINDSQLGHDYGQKRLDIINAFFAAATRHVGIELEETKQAMAKLSIPEPVLMEPITYNEAAQAKEWLIATEHLKVVQYLRQLYSILLTKCSAPQ